MVADLEACVSLRGRLRTVSSGPGLANIPIIIRATAARTPATSTTSWRIWSSAPGSSACERQRGNQVIFTAGLSAVAAGFNLPRLSLDTINTWARQPSPPTPRRASMAKVVRNKPATATDACWNSSGVRIDETQSMDRQPNANQIYPRFNKLRLVPASRSPRMWPSARCRTVDAAIAAGIYSPMTFSAGEVTRLKQNLPRPACCDWTKPGVNQGGAARTLPEVR